MSAAKHLVPQHVGGHNSEMKRGSALKPLSLAAIGRDASCLGLPQGGARSGCSAPTGNSQSVVDTTRMTEP